MRRLIHIPLIHSAIDLGSFAESVKAHYGKLAGDHGWEQREHMVATVWNHIERSIQMLQLDWAKTRLYQDGLPVCGFEEQIVREVAEAGSRNHLLVVELLDRGATLEGTEDPRLLMAEYEMQKRKVESPSTPPDGKAPDRQAESLLEARDAYIATRIDATLNPGETGLLFLGTYHRLDALQSTDIQVRPLAELSNEAVGRPRA
ncbi:MAG: hypothetical protein R6U98_13380 [Pirellulaceae bacterium]